VTSAEVNLSNAKLAQIRAENAVQIAKVTLKNAMGAPDLPDFSIVDTLAFHKYPITFEDAVQRAYANRPDLQSTLARKEASRIGLPCPVGLLSDALRQRERLTRRQRLSPEKSGWSAGLTLNFPSSAVPDELSGEGGEREPEHPEGQRGNASPGILLDVQQAYLNLLALEDGVVVAELTVRQAQENYEIVNGRYAAGVGSPLM